MALETVNGQRALTPEQTKALPANSSHFSWYRGNDLGPLAGVGLAQIPGWPLPAPISSSSNVMCGLEAEPEHRSRELCWPVGPLGQGQEPTWDCVCSMPPPNQPPQCLESTLSSVLIHSRKESSMRLGHGCRIQGLPGSLASIHFLCCCLSRSSRSSPGIHPPCYLTGCALSRCASRGSGSCSPGQSTPSQADCRTPPLSRLRSMTLEMRGVLPYTEPASICAGIWPHSLQHSTQGFC